MTFTPDPNRNIYYICMYLIGGNYYIVSKDDKIVISKSKEEALAPFEKLSEPGSEHREAILELKPRIVEFDINTDVKPSELVTGEKLFAPFKVKTLTLPYDLFKTTELGKELYESGTIPMGIANSLN